MSSDWFRWVRIGLDGFGLVLLGFQATLANKDTDLSSQLAVTQTHKHTQRHALAKVHSSRLDLQLGFRHQSVF